MSNYIYGIDVGGTTIKFGLFDHFGNFLKKWEITTDKSDNGKNIVKDIYTSILDKTPNLEDVIGYGLGVPGPVTNNFIPIAVNLGWKNVDLKDELKNLLKNEHIYVANDANIAALGEAAFGAGKGHKDVAMLTIGTGIGSGFVIDSNVIEGYHGAAGEIGHLKVNPQTPLPCNCGKKGCLETVASATGIKNTYRLFKKTFVGDSSLFSLKTPSAKAIFYAAKNNDELANLVVDYVAHYLGYACHVISATTNPSIIVIGGGVSRAGDFLINKIDKNFNDFLFSPVKGTKIVQAKLGNDAGIYGGAKLVINNG
jgi:glucokinase